MKIVRKEQFGLSFHNVVITKDPKDPDNPHKESRIETQYGAAVSGAGLDVYGFHDLSAGQVAKLEQTGEAEI